MRAIKIDSQNRTITEIEISGYEDMRAAVDGCICLAYDYPNGKNSCYVNDEGLLNNPQYFFVSKFGHQPFAGNGIIVGSNPRSGNTTACKLTLAEVNESIIFLTLAQVQRLIRIGAVEYSSSLTSFDGTYVKRTFDLGAFDKKKD